jgi:hypothetical protein
VSYSIVFYSMPFIFLSVMEASSDAVQGFVQGNVTRCRLPCPVPLVCFVLLALPLATVSHAPGTGLDCGSPWASIRILFLWLPCRAYVCVCVWGWGGGDAHSLQLFLIPLAGRPVGRPVRGGEREEASRAAADVRHLHGPPGPGPGRRRNYL